MLDGRKFREIWFRERSQRFAARIAVVAIALSILPVLLDIGPRDLGTALPLVVYALFLTFLGARYSYRLCWCVLVVVTLPAVFPHGDAFGDELRNTLFVSVGALALAWAHRQQRHRLQQRARIRRQLVGRVKSRARQLQQTGSELQLAVERSEMAHRTLLEHLPVHVIQKDLDGRFIFISQSFSQLLGHPIDHILGKTDFDFYDREIADKFRQDDQRVTRDGRFVDLVERTQLPNGNLAFMQVRKAPLRDSKGNIIGVQGIFWDITETLSGKIQLQRIESWAHALIQAALDAVLIVDIDGRVLEVNPAVATILGYQQQQQQHPPLGEIMRPAASDIAGSDSGPVRIQELTEGASGSLGLAAVKGQSTAASDAVLLNRLLKKATGRRIEVRLKRPDDTWFDAEISAHPLVVENSSGWAIFIRDITRRKRNVAELQTAKEAAERANLAKSEFVANVSHELRTPLTGIVGLHELLERSLLDDQQREYLALARTSSDNLLSLIDALLDFSKIEAHRLELEREAFDLVECVEAAAASLAARAQLRGLELVIDCAPELPQRVIGDGQRVRQILLNLIGNAIKFTQRGDICVRVRREGRPSATPPNPYPVEKIRFDVIDNGLGIPLEMQAVIFEAFRQADSSTTRRYGGTGLGLAICRELVHLMDGEISVFSRPNEGSTFTFILPLPVDAPADSRANGSGWNARLAPANAEVTPVALVAQSSLWCQTLERDLRAMGYQVVTLTREQLLAREPKQLFAAGNHTIVVADYRELATEEPSSLPVVERFLLAVPMALARPGQPPSWLRHADYRWLQRPICRADLVAALVDTPPPGTTTGVADNHEDAVTASAKILLVEDSPINQTVLQGILKQLGHQVTLARNGIEALQKCADQRFDIVLMDIQMPEVDGLEATRRIRADEQARGLTPAHIIALTAHAMPSDREQARQAGMNGFLVKPIPMEALRQAIASALLANQSEHQQEPDSVENIATFAVASDELPDWGTVELLMGGNKDLATEVVGLLRSESARLWQLLTKSVYLRDAREARRAAHTLKSNLRNLGLNQAAELAGQMETWAHQADWAQLQAQLSAMEQTVQQVQKWCTAMLQQRISV